MNPDDTQASLISFRKLKFLEGVRGSLTKQYLNTMCGKILEG